MTLRILHVIQSLNPKTGGPIEGVRQQCEAHRYFGHSIEVASLDRPASNYDLNVNFKSYLCNRTIADRILPITLYHWLKANHDRYDAVIINGIWGLHLLAVWIVLNETNIPYFVFSHGMLDPWFKRNHPLKHLKKWLVWPWAIYPVLRDADAVFFTCEKEKILARESFWLYDCNESVIKYGTKGIPNPQEDYSTSFLENHPDLRGKRLFLFLGRVHPKKGADLMIKSIADLKRQKIWDCRTMMIVIAGPKDNGYSIKMSRLAEKLDISESICWTGMISGNEKWGAFQSAEAFILPSHQENYGIAVVEALSCGIPVLISHSVNIADQILHDGAGFVEPDNLIGTSQLFLRWLDLTPTEKANMKQSARKCFEKNYKSIYTSTSITKNIYLSLFERACTTLRLNDGNRIQVSATDAPAQQADF